MDKNMEWFNDAKLGIFMHWGIYSVLGVTESWSFYSGDIDYDTYMDQKKGFTADKYDPAAWAELFRKAGARYTVLTSKHHDGVALWDTKQSDLSVVKQTPAGRDLIGPYCKAMRDAGLKVGLYFSHLDWNHPDYPCIHPNSDEWWATNKYTAPPEGEPDDLVKWEKFLKFHRAQLTELMTNYGDIDLLWFDGEWERTKEQWRFKELRDYLKGLNPKVILNGRMGGYGDYMTPEQIIPVVRPEGAWEYNLTINDSWGYNPNDNNYKSVRQLVRLFCECISLGGNMLLDIGPKPDGTIGEKEKELLLGLGEWIGKNSEAVYGTTAGLPNGLFTGGSTLSKDKRSLYLFLYDIPGGEICVKGIRNDIKSITVLGSDKQIPYKKQKNFLTMPGLLWFDLPAEDCNNICNVIKLEFDEPLDLYTGAGGGIK